MVKKTKISKRNSYSIAFKLRVITYAEKHNKAKAARKYKLDRKLIQRWCKNKQLYLKSANKRFRLRLYMARSKLYPELERRCLQEIKELREKGINVSGRLVLAYANTIAAELHPEQNFNASRGWLFGFLKSINFFIFF